MGLYVNLRVKALIFDIDGTLGDTMPAHWKAWSETGRKYGFDYPKELFYQNAGMPSRAIVALINRDCGLRLDPEQVTAAKDAAYLRHIREVQPLEPVVALVHKFHGQLPMGLGTGECRKIALQNIGALGLQKYFAALVSCDDVAQPKPDPETFLRCADRLGVAPEYCQVFEDGELGLEAARRAGMIATDVRPFLIPSGAEGPEAHSQKLRVS